MVISWKELSSSTAISSAQVSGYRTAADGRCCRPWTIFPSAASGLGDNGGRCRLSVGTGHPPEWDRGRLQKKASISEVITLPPYSRRQLRHIRPQTGGTEDHILMEIRQYSLPSRSLQP